MVKELIEIRACSKEMAERLYRGVLAVCPDADIRLCWPGVGSYIVPSNSKPGIFIKGEKGKPSLQQEAE